MIALWLGLGLLNAGAEPPVEPPVEPPQGGGSFQAAEAEWNARRKWSTEIDRLLQDEAAEAQASPDEGPSTQAAQDAPREPRTAQPAPIPLVPGTALHGLLAQLQGYRTAEAEALRHALVLRDRALLVSLAIEAERQVQEDEEAVLMLLLEAV